MWTAAPRSGGRSSEPPLSVRVSEPGLACQTREPQPGQNMQRSVRPLPVFRDQVLASPAVRLNAVLGTSSETPNAEAECFRHSRQWQT